MEVLVSSLAITQGMANPVEILCLVRILFLAVMVDTVTILLVLALLELVVPEALAAELVVIYTTDRQLLEAQEALTVVEVVALVHSLAVVGRAYQQDRLAEHHSAQCNLLAEVVVVEKGTTAPLVILILHLRMVLGGLEVVDVEAAVEPILLVDLMVLLVALIPEGVVVVQAEMDNTHLLLPASLVVPAALASSSSAVY